MSALLRPPEAITRGPHVRRLRSTRARMWRALVALVFVRRDIDMGPLMLAGMVLAVGAVAAIARFGG